ncbi:MAG TPA: DEAD/DEAH box helicase [Acidimicrobiia bacterium]|nr:DEAD/DEAH box helicase [Acidimicrobiia bacterium]
MTTFGELGLGAEIVDALAEQGINEPFPVQAATIADALAGRDVCGKAKTGSGKTLAFGLPAIQTTQASKPGHPTSLVLVPTRELAKQVVDVLSPIGKQIGVRVAAFYGGTSMDRQIRNLSRRIEVAVATPGRLIDLLERGELDLDQVGILIIDEADRMADMGFLPQVEWIMRKVPNDRQTLLFSATLDREVDVLVRRYMHDPVLHEVVSEEQDVDDMLHRFLKVHELDRIKVLAAISAGVSRTMVFVRTKRGADKLVSQLKREGVAAAAIHGDLRQSAREKALKDFQNDEHGVLVATDVAARGIHVDDVDVVVHYDPPEEHKSYVHRSGRTARAGNEGMVVTFVLWDQELEVERLQRRLGMREPIIEVFSNDARLANLVALDGPAPRRKTAGV